MFDKTSSTSVASTGDAMDICPNVSRKEISTTSLDTPYASMVKTTDRAQSQAEAAFPDYLNCILSLGPNFLPVDRVRFRRGIPSGISVKTLHAERSGVPLVLEGVHEETEWEADVFCVQELLRDQGKTPVETQLNETHKITTARGWLTECAYCATAGCPLRQDTLNITCPSRWREWLGSDALPQEIIPCGPNDLLDCVPSQFLSIAPTCDIRLGNSVSYMDRSVTVQHHLMVSSEPRASIIWIIVPVSSADSLVQYCRLKGEELDLGKTRVSIEDLVHAKCQVYVTEQKFGDLLLVPPNCFHQALNTNGMTINIVWSRMTIAGIKFSLHSQLDIYRRVCRPDSLRIKIVTFFATETLAAKLSAPESAFYMEEKDELALLLTFLKEVLVEEWSSECQKTPCAGLPWLFNHGGGVIGLAESASCLYDCSFCGASIFQSFFQCTGGCILPSKRNTLPLFCIGCVAEGRSCKCGQLMPMQCCNFQELLNVYNLAASYLDILPINDM
ncbi:hypothetical protein SISNIDRAFT_485333 [Sistotremastrum niveocremeum HHB9708]|uniref:JmjC domain-containing protein n=1 Tax=Sistotremastrum niveocremeum HHB9708 TaxID=1314777 RepID=A0A164V125_9AGAM|nr:hypothetical protein SISNIDRAFT_485333 [Sistotremastrum niveocremeum HHB9708]